MVKKIKTAIKKTPTRPKKQTASIVSNLKRTDPRPQNFFDTSQGTQK